MGQNRLAPRRAGSRLGDRRANELLGVRSCPATPMKNTVDLTEHFVRMALTCLTRKLRWSGCCEQAAGHATKPITERPDGSRVAVLVNIAPPFDRERTLTGAVNCFRDLSAQRRPEEERAHAESELRLARRELVQSA
jgi:hypothetical protein